MSTHRHTYTDTNDFNFVLFYFENYHYTFYDDDQWTIGKILYECFITNVGYATCTNLLLVPTFARGTCLDETKLLHVIFPLW